MAISYSKESIQSFSDIFGIITATILEILIIIDTHTHTQWLEHINYPYFKSNGNIKRVSLKLL